MKKVNKNIVFFVVALCFIILIFFITNNKNTRSLKDVNISFEEESLDSIESIDSYEDASQEADVSSEEVLEENISELSAEEVIESGEEMTKPAEEVAEPAEGVAEPAEEAATSIEEGKSILEMLQEENEIPDAEGTPEELSALVLPLLDDIRYELPSDKYTVSDEVYNNVLNDITNICLNNGYTSCKLDSVNLDGSSINYTFIFDDNVIYYCYIYFKTGEILFMEPVEY